MGARYIELHARSAFSFLDGSATPEELVDQCAQWEQPAIAMLDRDSLSGIVRFHKQAGRKNIEAHIGAEISCEGGTRLPLLVENLTGYRNLCRLITSMKMRGPKGAAAATTNELTEYAAGLVCLAPAANRQQLERLVSIYGADSVYVELQRHHLRDQEARNQHAIDLAQSLQLPLLATNGARYDKPHRRELLDVFTCLAHKTTLEKAGRLLERNAECYLKSTRQMERLFADLPEALDNTVELSDRLQFRITDFGYEFPRYPVPAGETLDSYLREMVIQRAPARFEPYRQAARDQLGKELNIIAKLKLSGYFLIVWDIVEFCRRENIMCQGRGSAANSAVCYALGITAADPVKMNLLFERFLSEERGEWPDIDIDLPSGEKRERAIQYVYQRYGQRGAAMTANIITYRGRSALRDIGKVLSLEDETLKRLARLAPRWGWKDTGGTPTHLFRAAGLDPEHPAIRHFLNLYHEIQDLPRHLGQHSGGMVICQGALDSIVPLEPATMPGRVVLQWDKEDCADMGLVKVDLLGLGMMAVLEETITLIDRHQGEKIDLATIPQDDPLVYETLQKADTIGLFQVESRAQMSCLPRLKPETFYHIVVQVAIIRPGPIVGKMLHPYLRRRQGLEAPDSLHPSLEEVLERTLGVPLFQEQLLKMAMIAARFSGGEAEELRRALGFKRSAQRMKEVEVRLRAGMTLNGIVGATQDIIIQSITSFALYGFPESHAISFALLAYFSAYLKCHHLAAFTAAMLNHQPMGFYAPSTLVQDAKRHGLRVRPVDANESHWDCTMLGPSAIRLGLNYVNGLPQSVAEALIFERTRSGSFTSVENLRRRVPELNSRHLQTLASIGAINFGNHRRAALWETALRERPGGKLLASLESESGECPLPRMTPLERFRSDFQGIGIGMGPHPLAYERERLKKRNVTPAADLSQCRENAPVRVAGCVIARQRPETAKGFAFLSLEDETGISNIIVSPDLFEKRRNEILGYPYLLISGILQDPKGAIAIRAQGVQALQIEAPATLSHDFH
ncbi:DNA polymerase III subunit alpha [Bryobacter aggregatus]|uniref:DNA polymerase III subunit alpha n=1 Tax=Bryobacter aggregatus TaxID=360054 RepID=UPI0004E1A651|nr:error-prone DNA polymerase [Bryobacter aggregatus]